MGKQSRRQSRRERPGRQRGVPKPLQVVIGTAPHSDFTGPSMESDLRLVRSAVLYADTVHLVSPAAAMLGSVSALAAGDELDVLQLVTSLDDGTIAHLAGNNLPDNWRDAVTRMALLGSRDWDSLEALTGEVVPPEVRAASDEWRDTLRAALGEFQGVAGTMIESSGAGELSPAIEAGILTLSSSGLEGGSDADDMVAAYVDILRTHLRDPSVHLLFDEQIRDLVRGLIDEGQVEPSALSMVHAGRAAVGTGLVARLPAFPGVPLDELLQLRADLEDPLSRYRRAVAEMARRLNTPVLDPALEADLDDLWSLDAEPALQDLRAGLADHGLVREAARSIATDVSSLVAGAAGSSITLGVSSWADLSGWLQVAGGVLPMAAALSGTGARALQARKAERQAAHRHDLFYLFELSQRLDGTR